MTKNVLITGGNRGIGLALVKAFAEVGCNIWVCARTRTETFEAAMAQLACANNVWIQPLYFDMTDISAMKSVIQSNVIKSSYSLDVLVNNAGVAHGGLFTMTKVQTIRDVFEINLFSAMELTQLVLRKMQRQKEGCIINFSSIAARQLRAGNSAYGVSKAAVTAWTQTLAAEVAQSGIRVNAVAPGLTDTNMAKQMEQKAGEQMIRDSAMNRLGKTEEIANVVLFLASGKASFVNGHTIVVNGGWQ